MWTNRSFTASSMAGMPDLRPCIAWARFRGLTWNRRGLGGRSDKASHGRMVRRGGGDFRAPRNIILVDSRSWWLNRTQSRTAGNSGEVCPLATELKARKPVRNRLVWTDQVRQRFCGTGGVGALNPQNRLWNVGTTIGAIFAPFDVYFPIALLFLRRDLEPRNMRYGCTVHCGKPHQGSGFDESTASSKPNLSLYLVSKADEDSRIWTGRWETIVRTVLGETKDGDMGCCGRIQKAPSGRCHGTLINAPGGMTIKGATDG